MFVIIMGGLGNQMFSYAFGECTSRTRNEEVIYTQQGLGPGSSRAYSLEAFDVRRDMKFIPIQEAWARARGHVSEPEFQYRPEAYTAPNESLYDGCWQTEKYWPKTEDVQLVRNAFRLRNEPSDESKRVAQQIQAGNSAFLHIRRTDYLLGLNPEFHGSPSMNYYQQAIELIRQNRPDVKFFVFSDDIPWCRRNFPDDFVYVDHNKMGVNGQCGQEHEDIWLMSLCRDAVIANSSFSWWGAWLGDAQSDRKVFAPARWFKTPKMCFKDIVPDRWIKLND